MPSFLLMNFRPVAGIIVQNREHILLVKKPRKDNAWQVPQGGIVAGESAHQAALRELHEECGPLQVRIQSELPLGEYEYEFPDNFSHKGKPYTGAHVQFFLAQLTGGTVKIDKDEIIDFQWVMVQDLADYTDPAYAHMLQQWLR